MINYYCILLRFVYQIEIKFNLIKYVVTINRARFTCQEKNIDLKFEKYCSLQCT